MIYQANYFSLSVLLLISLSKSTLIWIQGLNIYIYVDSVPWLHNFLHSMHTIILFFISFVLITTAYMPKPLQEPQLLTTTPLFKHLPSVPMSVILQPDNLLQNTHIQATSYFSVPSLSVLDLSLKNIAKQIPSPSQCLSPVIFVSRKTEFQTSFNNNTLLLHCLSHRRAKNKLVLN